MFRSLLICFICLILTVSVIAQTDACPAIMEAALTALDDLCADLERNQACYGHEALSATARDDADGFLFDLPGDRTALASIASLTLSPMDLQASTWGMSLLQVQANLPDTLPGQNVTMLLFGDVELSNTGGSDSGGAYGDMQAFYFRSGIGDAPCAAAPDSGILIQTPEGAGEIELLANNIRVRLGSTAFIQAQPGADFVLSLLEGSAEVTASGATMAVPAGSQVTVPLDEEGQPAGVPTYPQPYDASHMHSLPDSTLLAAFELAEPVDPETVPLLFTIPSITLNTDPGQRVLYPGPLGDFVAETRLNFRPAQNFHGAGIYAELSSGGRVEFVMAFCENGIADCVGRGLYFDAFSSAGLDGLIMHNVRAYREIGVCLQLEALDGNFTARFRIGLGGPWTDFATFSTPATITEVGILAQSATGTAANPFGAPNIAAVFTDFIITRP